MADSSFEAKFGQLSDTQVHDKAPVLAPYKVGFQVIEKNEDETRAVGIMAYKINKQWAYVPCFWLNGKLKGQNLLYLKQQDLFIPLTESWVNYIKTKQPFSPGRPTNKIEQKEKPSSPGNVSISEVGNWGWTKAAALLIENETWDRMHSLNPESKGISLEKWLPKLDKTACYTFINTLNKSYDFAEAVLKHYDADDLLKIASDVEKAHIKEVKKPELTVYTDDLFKEAADLSDSEKNILVRDGVYIKDERGVTSEVFYDNVKSENWTNPTKTGYYDILLSDGTSKPGVVILEKSKDVDYIGPGKSRLFVIFEDKPGETLTTNARVVMVKTSSKETEIKDKIKELTKPLRTEDLYNSKPVRIIDTKGNGVTVLWCESSKNSNEVLFTVNIPKYETCKMELTGKPGAVFIHRDTIYVPSDARMVTIENSASEHIFGNVNTVEKYLIKEGMDKLKIYADRKSYYISSNSVNSSDLTKTAALCKLVVDYGISAPDAKKILRESSPTGREFNKTGRYLIKYAKPYTDDELNAYGDHIGYEEEKVETDSSLDNPTIAEITKASQTGIKEVLDVTVMNSLVKKSRALEIVDDYLSDIMTSLDRVGRLLFLFYWHNESFKERYGVQSMYDLEVSLKDVFDATSDLVLFLREKTVSSNSVLENVSGDLSEDLGNA